MNALANEVRPEIPFSSVLAFTQNVNSILDGKLTNSISQQLNCELCQTDNEPLNERSFKLNVEISLVTNHGNSFVGFERKSFNKLR